MKKFLCLGLLCAALALCACKSSYVTIQNFGSRSLGMGLTLEQATELLVRAGTQHGWQMVRVNPNLMQALYVSNKDNILVEIPYTESDYSIRYKDSSDSMRGEEDGTIRTDYNRWVQILQQDITVEAARF
ncbi:MAG: hypothetical protein LBN33_01615 [Desulfovibrio sp.]|jgi:hypothetical protein|nr:hypothetical protein [Desulfovibrio sp.]